MTPRSRRPEERLAVEEVAMTLNPPRQFKEYAELTAAEIAERQAAPSRGELEPPMPETDAFKAHRSRVLESAGLPPDRKLDDLPAEELTVREHIERMARR